MPIVISNADVASYRRRPPSRLFASEITLSANRASSVTSTSSFPEREAVPSPAWLKAARQILPDLRSSFSIRSV